MSSPFSHTNEQGSDDTFAKPEGGSSSLPGMSPTLVSLLVQSPLPPEDIPPPLSVSGTHGPPLPQKPTDHHSTNQTVNMEQRQMQSQTVQVSLFYLVTNTHILVEICLGWL